MEQQNSHKAVFTFPSARRRREFIICLFGGKGQYSRPATQRVRFDRDRYTLTFLFWSEVSRRAFLGQLSDGWGEELCQFAWEGAFYDAELYRVDYFKYALTPPKQIENFSAHLRELTKGLGEEFEDLPAMLLGEGGDSRKIDLRVRSDTPKREDATVLVVDAFPDPSVQDREKDETWRDGMWYRPGQEEGKTE